MTEAGATSFGFNIEIWDDKVREKICPGKSKIPRNHYVEACKYVINRCGNGIFIRNKETARELKENHVHIILKMDTFDDSNFDRILGRKGAADQVYAARDYLLDAGYAGGSVSYTDLAFSIVPTMYSIEGIPTVVEFAEKHGIFASIGELEQAGEVVNKNLGDTLGISKDKTAELKSMADKYMKGDYMRPICPCILTGLHIDNLGNCIVDRDTGLNCKWFLLRNPQTIHIGNIYENTPRELMKKVLVYRKKCFDNSKKIYETGNVSYVFGGCGGNPKDIIRLARSMYVE